MSKIKKLERFLNYIIKGIPNKIIKVEVGQISSSHRLQGKNIIITGGGRGLGFSMAEKFVSEGANVLITGRNENTLKEAAAKLNGCYFTPFDVSDIAHIPQFMNQCIEKFGGRIDVLVNNAGISLHEKEIKNVTIDGYDQQFNTNLKAPYFLSQAFLNHCETSGNTNASILFITSERGLYCDDIPYGIIKAGINSLTQGLSCRYIKKGIRVNAIAPGVTVSDMTGYTTDSNLLRPTAIGERVFLAEEVAETATFLLSDASKCISGAIIPCNQGNHLRNNIIRNNA